MGPGTQQPPDNPALLAIQNQLQGGSRRTGFQGPGAQTLGGGIAGVASKAESEGIKIYGKHTKYNEWEFIYDPKEDQTSPYSRGGMTGIAGNAPSNTLGPSPSPISPNPGRTQK
jgi:hypothetical protein